MGRAGTPNRRRPSCARTPAWVEPLSLDAIIINSAGCGSTLKEYGQLLGDDPSWAERGRKFSARVKDLTEWLTAAQFDGQDPGPAAGRPPTLRCKVTYHDACHLAHPQHITAPPRELIRRVAGSPLIELPEADVCCGTAGSYNLTEPEMAERLRRRKVENILQTGASIVGTANPGCILQIRVGLRQTGAVPVEVVHMA